MRHTINRKGLCRVKSMLKGSALPMVSGWAFYFCSKMSESPAGSPLIFSISRASRTDRREIQNLRRDYTIEYPGPRDLLLTDKKQGQKSVSVTAIPYRIRL